MSAEEGIEDGGCEGVLVADNEEVVDVFEDLPVEVEVEEDSLGPPTPPPPTPFKPPRNLPASHIVQLPGENVQFHCLICGATFKYTQKRYHTLCPEENRPYQCSLCTRKFISKSHLRYHERTHTGETPYKCNHCGKGFKQLSKVKRHEKTHKDVKEVCPICKKIISCHDALKVHLLTHSKDKTYSCKECGKKYSRKADLNRHEFRHTEPRYVCDKCGKAFFRKHSLIKHIQLHSRKKVFKCADCKKTFKTKAQISRHSVIHEFDMLFECAKCSVTLKRKDNMERHMRNLHPGERITIIEKRSTSKSKKDTQVKVRPNVPPPVLAPTNSVIKHTNSSGARAVRVSVIKKLN